MACARILSFRIHPGGENQVTECLTRLDALQRQAKGYACRVSLTPANDPRHIMVVVMWQEKENADAFALLDATVACMARIKAVSEEIPITQGEYDLLSSDPADLLERHKS